MDKNALTLIPVPLPPIDLSQVYHVHAASGAVGYVFKPKHKRFWGYGYLEYRSEPIYNKPEDAALALALYAHIEVPG